MINQFTERGLLLALIEHVGKEWHENQRAEDIRLDPEKIGLLLGIRGLVGNPVNELSIEDLRDRCPVFVTTYRDVMLRDIEEIIPDGANS